MTTTDEALSLIACERAPRFTYDDGNASKVNRHLECADGFTVSVQASSHHYAADSEGRRLYFDDVPVAYPYRSFEIGEPSDEIPLVGIWDERESGGVWAFVPADDVRALLESHGGVVRFILTDGREV